MNPNNIPFNLTDWSKVPITEHEGETGVAFWRTLQFGDLRIRMVEYSKDYKADHWCEKGHIIFCIEGEMTTELSDGQEYKMTKGMSYQVSDELSSHKTYSKEGVKLFIIDGAFLKLKPEV
ncbi:MAG: DHCW motif cupin fold protein [Ginsengibacter sp.]